MKIILFVVILLCIRISESVNSCFYCESRTHGNCADPFNGTDNSMVECAQFLEMETAPVVTSRMSSPKKPFETIFEKHRRWKRSAGIDFLCAKTEVEYTDASIEMIRMCVPVLPYQAACPQLREVIGSGFKMRSCHECTGDNCNHSNQTGINFLLVALSFLFITIRIPSV